MENRASLIVGLIIVILASLVAWVFSPKGDNQTCVEPLPTCKATIQHTK